jgi:hypothetical protein
MTSGLGSKLWRALLGGPLRPQLLTLMLDPQRLAERCGRMRLQHLSALGSRYEALSCSQGARHERCATTTTTTDPVRVDLDRSRCARVGVGPCRMARIALNGCGLPRCCARLPQERQTTDLLAVYNDRRQEAHT